jgi:hypothetical protein
VAKLLFLEPVNLICLVIVAMAAFLTWDGWLALSGLMGEVAYVLLAWKAKWAQKLQEKRSDLDRLNVALLVVGISGAMIILFAGFFKHLLSNPIPGLTHSQTWQFCAVIWTILFLIYYFFKWKMAANQHWVAVSLFLAFACLLASLFAVKSHWSWRYFHLSSEYLHVILVAWGTLFILLADLLLWKKGVDKGESIRSRQSFLIADLPVLVAFVVLLACLLHDRDSEYPDVFLGGAVSFQLVLSNILFIVTEFNLLGLPLVDQQNSTPPAPTPS